MSVNSRTVKAPPEKVWKVLSDGWLYPAWVVGATRMRDVDPTWPQVGAKIHHSAGVWPASVDDNTEVLAAEPARYLKLRSRGWPMGAATVTLTITPSGDDIRVEIVEEAVSGPAVLMPKPAMDLMIKIRNMESLRRLAFIAENGSTD